MRLLPIAVAMFTLLLIQCSSAKSLSDTEKAKIDAPLMHLLIDNREDYNRIDITRKPDGTKEYAVIVQSEQAEAIRALGVNVSSLFGDIIVVQVTLEEFKKIVSLTTVKAVRTGSRRNNLQLK